MKGSGTTAARKVMVVVDPTRESASALQYALSHAVVESDSLILFHVENPNAWRNPFGAFFKRPNARGSGGSSVPEMFVESCIRREVDFLYAMKQACMTTHPKVKVAVVKAEMADGKDKASVILGHCKDHKVDLLIVGHRRSLSNAILGSRRGGTRGLDTADNLILNSKCTCVAVQKKTQNAGYLLSSKTYKNFWLLA
ncbi:hypothetical protein CASFOL_005126 [Castilleja foliolosa]|uniref:UspA domain-containing protein n=1 Tax=Castilleja foliolosa TaxID=1961234 RepID=A0ABD3E2W6_9LAMI